MPTYEYECKSCGHVFEVFQAMSDAPLKKCPECGKSVRRLIHGGTGIIFKGSGFYVTDKSKAASGASAKNSKDAVPAGGPDPKQAPAAAAPAGGASGGESAPKVPEGKTKPAVQTA
ncbi:MAG: zinc ribbon domain-containing protein [Treponema sp.]|jgi:putative FmdB family regulatory protein|nr:zinc ribbon domain-containing protein [Treponema sp.]